MEFRLQINPNTCIGCKTCELTCSYTHMGAELKRGQSRIQVSQTGPERYFPMVCLQCEDAACVKTCPVEAIKINAQTGGVEIDSERCVLCLACVPACPFGNIVFQEITNQVIKCDLCGGTPLCARFCPTDSLEYVRIRASAKKKSARG